MKASLATWEAHILVSPEVPDSLSLLLRESSNGFSFLAHHGQEQRDKRTTTRYY